MNTESNNKTCPKCGSTIPPEAPQGLCPKCVMSGVFPEESAGALELTAEDIPSIERVAAAFPNLDEFELVGRGGMGIVFKARQPHLDRQVALKLLPDKLAADPQFAERFNREGRVLARLNHSNIVSVYDFGQTEHFYYLMMEYVDGVNLREAMRAGQFSPAEALAIVPNICEALQYAHDQDVLHRDIKPENILLDTQGRAKIADFGIAKLLGEDAAANVTLTMTGVSLGTPHYMAPEQLEKPADVDHRADIYSLGVVLYEMLTGELPIGRFEAPSSKTPVGAGVDEVVFRALEKNRERRQNSAEELGTQVQTAKADTEPPRLTSPTAGKPTFSLPAIFGALLVGLSFLALITLLVAVFDADYPLGWNEVLIVGVPAGMSALVGTILGWVGLVQIRGSQGSRLGLPLGLFAAVTYPFGLPALMVVALPFLTLIPGNAGPGLIARVVIFALLAGTLSALGWWQLVVGRAIDRQANAGTCVVG
jgi:tRNA A-37 threonylcarbamoyl transferase component Bud32